MTENGQPSDLLVRHVARHVLYVFVLETIFHLTAHDSSYLAIWSFAVRHAANGNFTISDQAARSSKENG
jgi:hypothetical protein